MDTALFISDSLYFSTPPRRLQFIPTIFILVSRPDGKIYIRDDCASSGTEIVSIVPGTYLVVESSFISLNTAQFRS